MKCEMGFCLLCEKPIMELCPTCSAKRSNDQYTEVELELTNHNSMKVAVCLNCKDQVYLADKKEMMKAVREGWTREHDREAWTQEKRDTYWETHGEGRLEIV